MTELIQPTLEDDLKWWEINAAAHRALLATSVSSTEIGHQTQLMKAADGVVAALKLYLSAREGTS